MAEKRTEVRTAEGETLEERRERRRFMNGASREICELLAKKRCCVKDALEILESATRTIPVMSSCNLDFKGPYWDLT